MPIYHRDIAQYDDQYDKLKLGIPTSSNFFRIVSPTGKKSKMWLDYAHHLLAERWYQRRDHTYTSPHMERGLREEEFAVDWYAFDKGLQPGDPDFPALIGFITDDDRTMGCTPDRLVGEDGLVELKCPAAPAQFGYLLQGLADTFKPQLQGQLLISQRVWVDNVAWHDDLPKTAIRVERDDRFAKLLETELGRFVDYLENSWAAIQAKLEPGRPLEIPTSRPRPSVSEKLKADLQASLAREDKARSAGTVAAQTEVVGDRPMPGVLPHRGPGESSAPLPSDPSFKEWLLEQPIVYGTEPVPEPDAGGVARPERGRTVGEASANLASPKTCEQCDGPCDEAGYCRNPNCSAHWAYTSSSRESQTPGAEPGANSRRASGGERQTWTCGTAGCGMVFDSYSTFSKHRQRTGHKAETEQRPEALQAGRSSSGQDTVIAGLQVGVNTETRVRVPPDSTSTEETFWDIAARLGDYRAEIPDKNIATLGRDQMMNLVADAPTVEALTAFYQGNLGTIETMGKARIASRNELVKAMTRRKKELSGE